MTKCPTCGAATEAPRFVLSARPELTPEMQAAQTAMIDAVEAMSRRRMQRIELALATVLAMGLDPARCERREHTPSMVTEIAHDDSVLWRGGYERDGLTMRWAEEWMIPR